MKEDFLQFIWKMQLFQPAQLRSVFNETIKVLKPGLENSNEGPDFLNASIEINGQLWAGHVEIHIKSSDWYVHLHQLDANYNATVLHVVWEYDVPVYSPGNVELPTVELKRYVDANVLEQYKTLFQKEQKWISCEKLLGSIDDFKVQNWMETLYFERLEHKVEDVYSLYKSLHGNWEELLFLLLARAFGLKINGANFFEIAQRIPFTVFRKNSASRHYTEALLFGEAGLLLEDKTRDDYFVNLKKDYDFLRTKYGFQSPLKRNVHFFRLRPPNFPTIRLSQLAHLYAHNSSVFRKFMEAQNIEEYRGILNIQAHEYWDNHYVFGKETSRVFRKKLSQKLIDLILINAVLPVKFLYEREKQLLEKTAFMDLLEQLKAENNAIIQKFKHLKIEAKNALQSQALIQLKNEYCDKGKCLRCQIGKEILKNQF